MWIFGYAHMFQQTVKTESKKKILKIFYYCNTVLVPAMLLIFNFRFKQFTLKLKTVSKTWFYEFVS